LNTLEAGSKTANPLSGAGWLGTRASKIQGQILT
jgi:hypothetical protein